MLTKTFCVVYNSAFITIIDTLLHELIHKPLQLFLSCISKIVSVSISNITRRCPFGTHSLFGRIRSKVGKFCPSQHPVSAVAERLFCVGISNPFKFQMLAKAIYRAIFFFWIIFSVWPSLIASY